MSIHTDPQKRHDFVYLFEVVNGNPNGDPDAGNLPRFDPDTMHGLVTDVCLKRKVRDYVQTLCGAKIFIQSQVYLNKMIDEAFQKVGVELAQIPVQDDELAAWLKSVIGEDFPFTFEEGILKYTGESQKVKDIENQLLAPLADAASDTLTKGLKQVAKDLATAAKGKKGIPSEKRVEAQQTMLQDYYDIRMFGAVLSTGLNAGQVRGPMQLTFALSLSPILPLTLAITRQARTTEERMETGSTEMARKHSVPYGLYRNHGFFNPYLAAKTGITKKDLEIFWEALTNMFNYDRSAARGEMACRGLYIFTHDNPKGNASSHKLFELVKVRPITPELPPRQFIDYQVSLPGNINLATGVNLSENVASMADLYLPPGITLTILEG